MGFIVKCKNCGAKYERWNLGEHGFPYMCEKCLKKEKKKIYNPFSWFILLAIGLTLFFLLPMVSSTLGGLI